MKNQAMKSNLQRAWVAVLVMGALCGPVLAEPVGRHISAKIDLENSNDFKNIGGSNAKTKVQHRQLNVTLDNRDKEQAAVSVKWAIFAHKMDNNKLVTVKQGTASATVGALSTATVKSDRVTITGTPKHTVVVNNNRRNAKGKVQTTSKSEPANGEEYYGYSVQVFAGSELISETYSQPSLKPKQ